MQSLSRLRHERDRKRTQDDGKEGGKEKKDRSNELTARNRPTPLFEVDQIRHVRLGVACEGVAIWPTCGHDEKTPTLSASVLRDLLKVESSARIRYWMRIGRAKVVQLE